MTQTSALKQGQEKRLMGIVCVMSRIQTLPSLHFPLSLSHSISLSRSPSLSLFLPLPTLYPSLSSSPFFPSPTPSFLRRGLEVDLHAWQSSSLTHTQTLNGEGTK